MLSTPDGITDVTKYTLIIKPSAHILISKANVAMAVDNFK
jgi:hypothetical protein